MRNESRKHRKSSSWPKLVMKKWLNIRSSSKDFISDSSPHSGGGGGGDLKRTKSCSDKDNCFLITRDSLGSFSLSLGHGGWLVKTSQLDSIPPATQNLKTFVGTWNVGGKVPHEVLNLRDWLLTSSPHPADLYVIGLQEMVPLNAGNVLGAEDRGPAATWLSFIRRALNPREGTDDADDFDGGRYYLAASKQMVGIFMCVWAREGVTEHVSDVKVSCVGTGIMGYMGNKGSVSISMTIRRSTLCFVCSHLSSGEKDGDEARRNSDVMEILRRTRFPRATEIAPAKILQHDKIIWLGDLNYRLAAGCSNTTREMIEKNDWQALLKRDQLRIEQGAGRILRGWEEGEISFPPTYKYLPNSDRYAFTATKPGDKRRSPAWCDRILWRGNGMKQISYSRDESRFSDHRPVHSLFSVEVDNFDRFQDTATTAAADNCSSNSSCSRVQAEELLVITRTQSCLTTTRF